MPPPATPPSGVAALNTQVDSSVAVVRQFKQFVRDIFAQADSRSDTRAPISVLDVAAAAPPPGTAATSDPSSALTETPVDALALARDAASLVRAHATKISLLIINEPFTPSAVSSVVGQLLGGPVPALAQAAEVCYSNRYTRRVRRDLALRCERVLAQVLVLLEAIPRDGRVVPEANRGGGETAIPKSSGSNGAAAAADRGSFAKTGILWAECDDLVAFANLGVRGRLIQLVEQWADTLSDELDELREWGEEEDDDDEDEDGDDDGDDDDKAEIEGGEGEGEGHDRHAATQAMLDALMNAGQHISAADPLRMRPRLEVTLKKIRLVILLYKAIVKRRLRRLPTLPTGDGAPTDFALRLDNTVAVLQKIPDRFGDLAAAFYEMNVQDVDKLMLQCFEDAFVASEILALPWEGEKDEFTDWAAKFQTEMKSTLSGEK